MCVHGDPPWFQCFLFGEATIIGIREKRGDRAVSQEDLIEADLIALGAGFAGCRFAAA
jgi:hypothetical protein